MRDQPAGMAASGAGGGSAATREMAYRSNSGATSDENHVACLGSHTMGPLYTVRTTSRNAVTIEASNESDGGNCTSRGPRFSAKPSVCCKNVTNEARAFC